MVAPWQAWRAGRSEKLATEQVVAARKQAQAAEYVNTAREQLEVAQRQAGNIGRIEIGWVRDWRHGPVSGLLQVQAASHEVLQTSR